MSTKRRPLTEEEKAEGLAVLQQSGHTSFGAAESKLSLSEGTFRDRILGRKSGVSAAAAVKLLLQSGVRSTASIGEAGREKRLQHMQETGCIVCRTCKKDLPVEEFKAHATSLGGRHQHCRKCEAAKEQRRRNA